MQKPVCFLSQLEHHYSIPKNMSSTKESECLRYDIVIVGAGPSAMGLLYGLLLPYTRESNPQRLTPPFTVAVVDRGEASSTALHQSINTRDPKRWGYAAFASNSSSVIYTRPQVGLNNRMIGVPVGKGVGGTSNINACLVCQPQEDDFEKETSSSSSTMEQTLWTANVMLTAAKTIERVMDKNRALTRRRNWLVNFSSWISQQDQDPPLEERTSLCSDITLLVRTMNSDTHIRSNYFEALIQPLLEANPHLYKSITFLNPMLVERIIFAQSHDDDSSCLKATGVECSYRKSNGTTQYCRVDAVQCVILAGGAILSPALLLASGLGDSCSLDKAGIVPLCLPSNSNENKAHFDAIETWKGIGQGLNDHMILPRFFFIHPRSWTYSRQIKHTHPAVNTSKSQDTIFQPSINGVQGWITKDIIPAGGHCTQYKKGRNMITVFDGSATPWLIPEMAFSTLYRPFLPMIVLAYVFKWILQLLCSVYPIRYFIQHFTQLVAICLMSPKSQGSVTLVRKEYRTKQPPSFTNIQRLSDYNIVVDPAYLTHPEDVECLRQGWQYSEKWISQQQSSIEILPGLYKYLMSSPNDQGRWFNSYASNFANPFFHWSGSLRMKKRSIHYPESVDENDKDYVLENDLRVRNTTNVYVCCASAFPNPISVPTALTCAALGFVLVTRILNPTSSTIKQGMKEKGD